MASRFDQVFSTLGLPALQREFGVMVRIERGVNVSGLIPARRGARDYAAIGAEYGIEITITMWDYLLPVDAVIVDGDLIVPRVGDRIHDGSEVYEVQPYDPNKPAVEYQSAGNEWLIHTKRIV
jgi:hypothetical protein